MKVGNLSGWGQSINALDGIIPGFCEKIYFDYSKFGDVKAFFENAKEITTKLELENNNPLPQKSSRRFEGKKRSLLSVGRYHKQAMTKEDKARTDHGMDILIGWSLGGQLATRLVAEQILKPKFLILIAPPFQFVKSDDISSGMGMKAFEEFRENFVRNPDITIKKFSILSKMNDKNSKEMSENLEINEENHQNLVFWLDELRRFSCKNINYQNFPPTLLFHGMGDMIIHVGQAEMFAKIIPHIKIVKIPNCGHAPQFSYSKMLKENIEEWTKDWQSI